MFENSEGWITGITGEEVKNRTICVYNSKDGTIYNLKNRDEIVTEIFVFVDASESKMGELWMEEYIPDSISTGIAVRCLRVHVLAT
jgi:hypothetical protein